MEQEYDPYTSDSKDSIVEESPSKRFIRFNDLVGTGAYKMVYRAYDNQTGCDVAWVSVQLSALPKSERRRLADEITTLKSLNHPNIVGFITQWANRTNNEVVFITNMLNAGSLKQHLRRIKRARLRLLKGWIRSILEGLKYLHSKGIIHRDIKCDNIFVNSTVNTVMIGDLGLACTQSNSVQSLGTPEFMAPQTLNIEITPTPALDIWALGLCTLQMATNMTPYRECRCIEEVIKSIRKGIRPTDIDRILNKQLRKFIQSCIVMDPMSRPTAAELLDSEFLNSEHPKEDDAVEIIPDDLVSSSDRESISLCESTTSKDESVSSNVMGNQILFKEMYLNYRNKLICPESQIQLERELKLERKIFHNLQIQQKIEFQKKKGPRITTEISKTLRGQHACSLIEGHRETFFQSRDSSPLRQDLDKSMQQQGQVIEKKRLEKQLKMLQSITREGQDSHEENKDQKKQ